MDLSSYLMGKNSSSGGADLSEYFITEIENDTTVSSNYALNLVKMTAPLTINNSVTSLGYCFVNSNYQGIDLSQADTSNITNMENMFQGCTSLENLDVENLDVSNVTKMGYMFQNCIKLKKLNLSKWTPKSNVSINYMFQNCKKLAILDVSTFSNFGSGVFSSVGSECLQSDGAFADGKPYVYVKNETLQSNIVNGSYGAPSSWTTDNVIVKNS